MNRRIPVAIAATAALGASALAIAPAIAAPAKKNQIVIRDGTSYKPGFWVRDNMRFTPFTQTVRKGATVTLLNKGPKDEPHSISFVKKSQLPKTNRAINRCSIPKGICLKIAVAHQVDLATGNVGKPVVDVNKPGVDGPGDSLFIPPGQGVKFKVTAKKGTTLYFMCAVHPWMQGSVKVR
ncbi:MAG TPA: plastocyanin/azurin family copper-binding protein [Solirubrobacteraceae bacterium]|jgi:plastocyanin